MVSLPNHMRLIATFYRRVCRSAQLPYLVTRLLAKRSVKPPFVRAPVAENLWTVHPPRRLLHVDGVCPTLHCVTFRHGYIAAPTTENLGTTKLDNKDHTPDITVPKVAVSEPSPEDGHRYLYFLARHKTRKLAISDGNTALTAAVDQVQTLELSDLSSLAWAVGKLVGQLKLCVKDQVLQQVLKGVDSRAIEVLTGSEDDQLTLVSANTLMHGFATVSYRPSIQLQGVILNQFRQCSDILDERMVSGLLYSFGTLHVAVPENALQLLGQKASSLASMMPVVGFCNTINGLTTLGGEVPPEFLAEFALMAVKDGQTFSDHEICRSLYVLSHVNGQVPFHLVDLLVALAQPRLFRIRIDDLTHMVWGLARLQRQGAQTSPEFRSALVTSVHERLHNMNVPRLCKLLYQLSNIQTLPAGFINSVCTATQGQLHSLQAMQLANLTAVLGMSQTQLASDYEADLLSALKAKLAHHNATELSYTMLRLSKMKCRPSKEFVSAATQAAHAQLQHMRGKDVAHFIWGLANLNQRLPSQWLATFAAHTKHTLHTCDVKQLSMIINGLARLGQRVPGDFASECAAALRLQLNQLDRRALGNSIWCMATMHWKLPHDYLTEYAAAARSKLHELDSTSLRNLIYGLVKLGCPLQQGWLTDFAREAKAKLHDFSSLDLSLVIWSLSKTGHSPNPEFWDAFLCEVDAKVLTFTRVELTQLLYATCSYHRTLPAAMSRSVVAILQPTLVKCNTRELRGLQALLPALDPHCAGELLHSIHNALWDESRTLNQRTSEHHGMPMGGGSDDGTRVGDTDGAMVDGQVGRSNMERSGVKGSSSSLDSSEAGSSDGRHDWQGGVDGKVQGCVQHAVSGGEAGGGPAGEVDRWDRRRQELEQLTLLEGLRPLCRKYGLRVTGKKNELVKRIQVYEAEQGQVWKEEQGD